MRQPFELGCKPEASSSHVPQNTPVTNVKRNSAAKFMSFNVITFDPYPPAIAPIIKNGSTPVAIASGNGASGPLRAVIALSHPGVSA